MTSADPPKLLVLLGAGASHGYGPSTAWLTRRLLAAHSGPRGAPLLRLVHQGLRALLSHRTLHGIRETVEPNFEEIIQAVDEIAGHAPSPTTVFGPGRAESLLSPFVTLKPSLRRLRPQQERYRRYASRAREFVVRQTIRYCDGAPDPGGRAFVTGLTDLSTRARLRLMSLNYDDLPAASGIDFYTGFAEVQGPGHVFRRAHPWPDERHLWCQLHGSVLFRLRMARTEVGPLPLIVRYASRREAARRKWLDVDWRSFQDRHIAPVAPIITGLRKADAIQREPYADYAHVFREQALSCDRWLIVGYGGGDEHVNNVLSQARGYWRESGREQRVLVVGHYPLEPRGQRLIGLMEQRPESGLGREMWLFDEELYPFETVVRPRAVSDVNGALGVTFDGVDWALGEGLPEVRRFLQL